MGQSLLASSRRGLEGWASLLMFVRELTLGVRNTTKQEETAGEVEVLLGAPAAPMRAARRLSIHPAVRSSFGAPASPARRLLSASAPALSRAGTAVEVSPTVEAILKSSFAELDPQAPDMLGRLQSSDAALIWHKHSSFVEHLRGVWLMMVTWDQPQSWCRLGLCHSVRAAAATSRAH